MRRLFMIVVLAVAVAGCASSPSVKEDPMAKAPDWINGDIDISGKFCAVGISGATMYHKDAIEVSEENCKVTLADNMQSTVKSHTYDEFSSTGGGKYRKEYYVKGTDVAVEAVLRDVEVLDHFYDKKGTYSGGQESTYSLCCVPKSAN